MTVTARQYVALHLYYVEGWSQRKIGRTLCVTQQAVSLLIRRGRQWAIDSGAEHDVVKSLLTEGLFRSSPTSSLTRNVGQAASRREELLDALERRMAHRDAELADIEECMAGDSFSPTRTKRNHCDQWELRYLAQHECLTLPDAAYRQKRRGGGPAQYCAARGTCTITPRCCGCHD